MHDFEEHLEIFFRVSVLWSADRAIQISLDSNRVTRPNQKPQTKLDFDHVPLLARGPFHLKKRCNCSLISLVERKTENRRYWKIGNIERHPWFWSLLKSLLEIIINNSILVLYDRSFLIIGAILTKLLSHGNVQITYDVKEPFYRVSTGKKSTRP